MKYIYKSDLPYQWQTFFQDPSTPIMESIIDLYQSIFVYLIIIFAIVILLIKKIISEFDINKNGVTFKLPNAVVTEILWTTLPILVLFSIGVPSFILLYSQDEIITPFVTLKAIGYQWYWSYEMVYKKY